MAMLTSKSPYGAPLSAGQRMPSRTFSETSLRAKTSATQISDSLFISPTGSEFSEIYDGADPTRAWDEKRVGEWLHSIKCGQYEAIFKAHNFTGESLLECDQKILAEIGIKKIGDRVRINVAIKQLRNKTLIARDTRNRESMAALEALSSPPADPSKAAQRLGNKRLEAGALKGSSRPSSPLAETHLGGLRSRYAAAASPIDGGKRDATNGYFSQPNSASSVNGRRPETPQIVVQNNINKSHLRQNSSIDGLTPGGLPSNSPVIKIVHNGGQTKVVNVKFCRSPDEVTMTVLKKVHIPEKHFRNYCFYVLDGLDARQANCRVLSDEELMSICGDASRSERNRLILRKINDGLPDLDEVKKAAKLASDENQALHINALNNTNMRNQIKLQQLTGESWSNIQAPLSPGPMTDRHQQILAQADEIERAEQTAIARPRKNRDESDQRLRAFFGARPPSEMIVQELTSYFPGHQKEDIEKTMRMSIRRSQRMSRAASRLSVVSNISMASSLRDAPPVPAIPSIADAWLTKPGEAGIGAKPRPLSVSRFIGPSFRDSIASSSLSPLQEESPTSPNRKSYVSFADSGSDGLHADTARHSYFEELSPVGTGNMSERLSMLVGDDGEEADPELADFLRGNNFDKNNWMKGDLIGEGSFGSVYLALHAITGELMAVKQVELPDVAKGTESDKKKQSMVAALKLEIQLLQGLHHPHIVQYLGTSSDETHLNIFLDYVPGGSIAAMLKQYNTFPEQLTRNFTRQILDGLSYLHNRNIIHRDIKGANILVDNRGAVKISDFGVSKQTTSNLTNPSLASNPVGPFGPAGTRTSLQGSVFWMAPEVVRQTGQSIKSDIWSVGCLIVEMFTGSRPFPSMTTLQTLFAVGSQGERPKVPENASADAKKFLDLCFEVDMNKRPTAGELLKEPFCKGPMGTLAAP